MSEGVSNNKRIAKNTLFLYFRMILIMGVQLYTVRVVLSVLGSTDYGLNNVVGGIVTMFSFLSGTMATASQRYFSYEIGRGDLIQLKKTFSITLIIYCCIAFIILLLAETVGLWFLNYKMVIPENRIYAANWVYQFSILSFLVTMFQVPYDALVIAREKMNVYAYVSILEVILKLLIVYLLTISSFDKLIMYSFFTFSVTLLVTSIYKTYCVRNYKESHFIYYWDKIMFKDILSYSGWNLFGAMAGIVNNQGINILLNLFFGPVVNAARAIAYQINSAMNSFVQNFMTATRPQITKYYAQGQNENMLKLVFQSSKFSFFLLFLIALPVMFEMPFILNLWLKDVPENTILFGRIIIVTTLVDTLSYSLMAAFQATGKIKIYQIVVGSLLILNLPISYMFFKLGYSAEMGLYLVLINAILCLFLRLFLLKKIILTLNIFNFFKSVFFPILLVSLVGYLFLNMEIRFFPQGTKRLFLTFFISMFTTIFSIVIFGIEKDERKLLTGLILKKIKKR